MAFQTVTKTFEIRWIAEVGYSGNELPPSKYEVIGEFETEADAGRVLDEKGLTPKAWGWYGNYAYGHVVRKLVEIE